MNHNLRYLDLFSGVGGFRAAFELIPGMDCMGHCEIDEHADKSYRALFSTEGEWFCSDARVRQILKSRKQIIYMCR